MKPLTPLLVLRPEFSAGFAHRPALEIAAVTQQPESQQPQEGQQPEAPAPQEAQEPAPVPPPPMIERGAGAEPAETEVAPPPPGGLLPQQSCMSTSWLWILGMIAIFYFLLIRPQQKQEKQRRQMLSAIKKGDQVVTTGGVWGIVSSLGDDTATLAVDPQTQLKIDRSAIARVVGGEAKPDVKPG